MRLNNFKLKLILLISAGLFVYILSRWLLDMNSSSQIVQHQYVESTEGQRESTHSVTNGQHNDLQQTITSTKNGVFEQPKVLPKVNDISFESIVHGVEWPKQAIRIAHREECKTHCKTKYNIYHGYPNVFKYGSAAHSHDFICPTMFRDLADYVYEWPYAHFSENVSVGNIEQILDCLPPVPVIMSKGDSMIVRSFLLIAKQRTTHGFILLTNQAAVPTPGNNHRMVDLPDILHWYGVHPDIYHSKFEPLPLGLNCYEHGEAMGKYIQLNTDIIKHNIANKKKLMDEGRLPKLAVVNFARTNPIRIHTHQLFCNSGKYPYIECIDKSWSNDITGNSKDELVDLYTMLSKYPFWISPRGNGLDTHRVYEALYIGAIPVVETSLLDSLYSQLPVLIVTSYRNITEQLLRQKLSHFATKVINWSIITRGHWWNKIESFRDKIITKANIIERDRYRCWA